MRTIRKVHVELEQASLPESLLLARNTAVPLHEIQTAIRRLGGFGEEAERVVFTPLAPVVASSNISGLFSRGSESAIGERLMGLYLSS